MSKPIIEVNHLSKRYRIGRVGATTFREDWGRLWQKIRGKSGDTPPASDRDFWALRDISFSVQEGEVLGVIGRNGAGKSTLLKILSRITEPTSGGAVLRGRIASLLEVGTGFHPDLTGRENVYLNGAILGMKRAEIAARFDEIVAFAEVEKFIDTPVKHYSSGMRVRLAFAVAAHLDSEILIADEVLAVGDAAFQSKSLGKMEAVSGQGRTILFVSHQPAQIRSLCHRVIWLQGGCVHQDGATAETLESYLLEHRPTHSTSVRFANTETGNAFTVEGISLNNGQAVFHGEPLQVDIRFHAQTTLGDLALGMGFSTLDDIKVMTLDSDVSAGRHVLTRSGNGYARLNLPSLTLAPGLYKIDVGARDGPQRSIWYRRECATIEVLPGPRTPDSILRANAGVCPPPHVEWH